jgi:hypothetical protein
VRLFIRFVSALVSIAAGLAVEYLPIQPGNTWFYWNDRTEFGYEMRVGITPRTEAGRQYYQVTNYLTEQLWMRSEKNGDLYYWDEDKGEDTLLTSFDASGAAWFPAPKRPCPQDGHTGSERVPYRGPAGNFASTVLVRYRSGCPGLGFAEEQYLENVGMLGRTILTLKGPVVWHLAHASLGTIQLVSHPNSLFSVGLRWLQDGRLIGMLRLRGGTGIPSAGPAEIPIPLTYPTSQEFDLVLRSESGEELWRWSAGKLFDPQITQRLVSTLAYEVEVPLDHYGQRLPPGTYILEGWLTTEPGDRQFAASIAFQIFPEEPSRLSVSGGR